MDRIEEADDLRSQLQAQFDHVESIHPPGTPRSNTPRSTTPRGAGGSESPSAGSQHGRGAAGEDREGQDTQESPEDAWLKAIQQAQR